MLQSDGKAVVSFGIKGATSYESSHGVARFTMSGTLDAGFGGGGWSGLDPVSNDAYPLHGGVGLQSTGKILIALPALLSQAPVGRLKANGALDKGRGGFGPYRTGYTQGSFGRELAVQANDRVLTVGTQSFESGQRLRVTRYTADGLLDWTFNGCGYHLLLPDAIGWPVGTDITLQSNGKAVVVGYGTGIDGAPDMLVIRFNTNGTLDTSFGGGAGYVRLDVDGTASVTFETARGLAIQPDGKIVVAGTLAIDGLPNDVLVVRLNANGTPDATFGLGGFKRGKPPAGPGYHSFAGNAVALKSDGSIIVAGFDDWLETDYEDHPLLMRFEP